MIPQIMRPVVEGSLLSSAKVLEKLDKRGNKKTFWDSEIADYYCFYYIKYLMTFFNVLPPC